MRTSSGGNCCLLNKNLLELAESGYLRQGMESGGNLEAPFSFFNAHRAEQFSKRRTVLRPCIPT